MATSRSSALLVSFLIAGLVSSCGGDDDGDGDGVDELQICEDAFDASCACPGVSCSGRPVSCTGPDRTWAECINAAEDPCTADCT
jgi:hypothetical protein